MAYFLPSYFQKRLLRYALSRLDFLDSHALDLENLAFTIGQRSVIELKNVGIQVSKVVERLNLPAAVVPQNASIRVVRITIPADLHVSGIEVEIDGINIEINVDPANIQDETRRTNVGVNTAPSHKDVTNQPRIGSATTHDPGGIQIIPSSQDLAASFLQAEPAQEREELQAAVESRSTYLPQLPGGLDNSTSEAGYGMPEGFSLPGFVATFFAGVADRLSVRVQNVVVSLSTYIVNDQSVREPLQFVLKVAEIELQGLKNLFGTNGDLDLRRSVNVSGIELLLSSQGDLLSQKSTASSPKLSKAKSPTSAFSRQDSLASSGIPRRKHSGVSQDLESSSTSVVSSRASGFGLGLEDSMLESSQIFDPSLAHSEYESSVGAPERSRLQPDELQSESTSASRKQSDTSSEFSDERQPEDDDLAQSKFFSHEDAESMYMSALSTTSPIAEKTADDLDIPAGDATEGTSRGRSTSENTLTPMEKSSVAVEVPDKMFNTRKVPDEIMVEDQAGFVPFYQQSLNQCSKCLLSINEMKLKLPVKAQRDSASDASRDEITGYTQGYPKTDRMAYNARLMPSSHARNTSESFYGMPQEQDVELEESISYQISVGDIEIAMDINLCHVLLKSATQLSQVFVLPSSGPKVPEIKTKTSDLQIKASVRSVALNLMESVPEYAMLPRKRAPTESTFSVHGDDTPLLRLQILKVQVEAINQDARSEQKVTINRFALYRESDKILSFFDPANLQESFVAQSVVLEPNDILIYRLDNRIDVFTKSLRAVLDLVILDDVLSRSGGLSSLLELGNSVASTKDGDSRAVPANVRPRSVRFNDTSAQPESTGQDDDGLKFNLRVSATLIDVTGSQSFMQVKSSSVKLAYRSGRFKTKISSVLLRGPIVQRAQSNDLVTLRFSNIELIYLNTPEEEDLDRLLQLIAPSSEEYDQDDDIMVDTLLRQRRKGGVMRLTIQDIQFSVNGLAWTQRLTQLGEEISKLSTVTKYLPEDDRPGVLTFVLINKLTVRLEVDKNFGPLVLRTNLLEGAHISVPSLMAAQVSSFHLSRGRDEVLLRELIPNMQESVLMGPPMLMCRFIADEMEPTVKFKLSNACFEYSVPLLLAITQLAEIVQKEVSQEQQSLSPRTSEISDALSEVSELSRKVKFSLTLRTSAISLQPLDSPASALFVFTDAVITHSAKRHSTLATLEIRKASIMIIDDTAKIGHGISGADPKLYFDQNDQVQELVKSGYVPVGSISAAAADIKMTDDKLEGKQYIDVEFRNNLLFIETCADSTQTLIQILGALSPPSAPSKTAKYRTEIIPLSDMLNSFTGNAFVSEKGPELGMQIDEEAESTPTPSTMFTQPARNVERVSSSDDEDETFMNDLALSQAEDEEHDQMTESSIMSTSSMPGSIHVAPVNLTADEESSAGGSIIMHSMLDLRDGHFTHKTSVGGTAHRWNSARNTYEMGSEVSVQKSPLKVRVREVHVIWNLFDGYDWQNTRDVISQAVRDVEDKALAKQRRKDSHRSSGPEEEDESVVGDVLFNSIYISIPTNRDPRELTNAINMELGDAASETGSYATSTTVTATSTKRYSGPRYRPKKLKLNRSKQHKMTFELEGVAADFLMFPPGSGEVESSTDIRVRKLEVFDHVPTSTWKKFATYMHEAGEREAGTDMVHIELLNVRPVAELAASEMVMKLTVLPLRLHVDQDALDFLTRFFEFKDDRTPPSTTPSTPPFLQRVEVNPIRLRLDFKPKRVDYAGLKSGRTTEFMNFFILDRADMVLRRVILYGVSGFDRLGIMLNNIWSPDVRNNQLPGVLAGLAPVRSLVDVGSGVRDLVAVPIREYKKDGRIVRSIQKGAIAFAKTTTTELVNLGAKLAIGTQTVLQNAEGVLAPQNKPQSGFGSDSEDDESQKQISHYADQPLGIVQGLRGAYASLERDLLLAKDAIVAVPGEIMADGSATGAAKVILKQSPTIILRPAIGVTKAMGQAFLGAGNTLDKGNRRRIEDKYKRY